MARTVKTAVSIPVEDFRRLEALRRRTGKSRSAILVESFAAFLAALRREEQDRLYEEAYRTQPEDLQGIEAMVKAGLPAWGKERW